MQILLLDLSLALPHRLPVEASRARRRWQLRPISGAFRATSRRPATATAAPFWTAELATELQHADKARKALQDAGSQPPDRLQPLRDTLALHERNVESLKKELGNLR